MVRRTPATSASTQNEEHASPVHLYLSPLTQGTLTVTFTEWACLRLIPADAGKTLWGPRLIPMTMAHPPRIRGTLMRGNLPAFRLGLTPAHTRKQRLRTAYGTDSGLIPAHTGNAQAADSGQTVHTADPRAYGERSRMSSGCSPASG